MPMIIATVTNMKIDQLPWSKAPTVGSLTIAMLISIAEELNACQSGNHLIYTQHIQYTMFIPFAMIIAIFVSSATIPHGVMKGRSLRFGLSLSTT
jgi:divalent metal cation (Fe/Co/Zn/Cd) transporter